MARARSQAEITDLLPDDALLGHCRRHYGLSIESVFLSDPPIGGDLWGLLPIDEGRLAIFCVDVCGHGPEVAPHTRYVYDLLHSGAVDIADPAEVLHLLNLRLHGFLPRGRFVAIWYSVIDVDKNTLSWSASTFMPQLYRAGGASGFAFLPGEGFPLGFRSESDYVVHQRPFFSGATLVLYSDALVETPLPPDSVFTTQSLRTFLNAQAEDSSARQLANAVIERLDVPRERLTDDLTLVVLFRC
ncbi:Phosphoserine phosphatase RsbU (plasmid) [Asticcacaulis sp. MM231]|uniref:PP2C family protein-serine/threonine phosphatase n=1 Tax=Asticcacaulis sp. MM231 TaxID=3157666 RepID=UPI0032D5A4EE